MKPINNAMTLLIDAAKFQDNTFGTIIGSRWEWSYTFQDWVLVLVVEPQFKQPGVTTCI